MLCWRPRQSLKTTQQKPTSPGTPLEHWLQPDRAPTVTFTCRGRLSFGCKGSSCKSSGFIAATSSKSICKEQIKVLMKQHWLLKPIASPQLRLPLDSGFINLKFHQVLIVINKYLFLSRGLPSRWVLFSGVQANADVSDENEAKRKAGRRATVDLGRLAPPLLCWAVGSLWAQWPKHLLLADTEEETSSNCPRDGKMGGPPGCYVWGQVPKSCYLTLSLPTFFNWPRNFFCSHSVLLMLAMRSQFWVYITRVLKLSRNHSNFTSILYSRCKPRVRALPPTY